MIENTLNSSLELLMHPRCRTMQATQGMPPSASTNLQAEGMQPKSSVKAPHQSKHAENSSVKYHPVPYRSPELAVRDAFVSRSSVAVVDRAFQTDLGGQIDLIEVATQIQAERRRTHANRAGPHQWHRPGMPPPSAQRSTRRGAAAPGQRPQALVTPKTRAEQRRPGRPCSCTQTCPRRPP